MFKFIFILLFLSMTEHQISTQKIRGWYHEFNFIFNPTNIENLQNVLERQYTDLLKIPKTAKAKITNKISQINVASKIFMLTITEAAFFKISTESPVDFYMLDRQLAYFHERKTGLCMLLENRRKLAESIALKFPSDDIFKNLKYKTKEEIICKDNNKISEILKKHSNIIYEIAFMVFDKYIMEKRTSFKEMLLNHKLNDQDNYLAYGRILKSIFGSKLYFVLGMKYTELFKNTDNNFDFIEFYNEYFKSNIVGKWRIKSIIEYFIYKEWFDHFEQANKLNDNFVAIWNKIFSNYWMGENFLQKYFAYFDYPKDENDIFVNIIEIITF
uniref:Uncharacterized protein n=1 Tax=Meloidogyne enterolobii TaxID=390850 RepID=A0A6V7X1U2_MELEN|nr:unnamed protein product [Meloidogyne enterolobii]